MMASRIGINLRVTGHCHQGGRRYMEDAFAVAYQQTENEKDLEYAYFGIFDGHGGREAALFAKEHLMDNIVNQKCFWSDSDEMVLKAIKDGFRATHQAMWRELGKWPKTVSGLPSTSGTTASIVFVRQGKMYIGHVGDSRIVLGYQEPGVSNWLSRSLTKDHKPESPAERKRIYSVGGHVMEKSGVERVVWNRPKVGHRGPVRRSTQFDLIPFLAVARSLGDLWSYNYTEGEFIVSPEPDVSVVSLDPKKDRCIILASDGLWNVLTSQEAVRIVERVEMTNERNILDVPGAGGKPGKNPSKELVDDALFGWCNLNVRADNTSVVTVLMDPPGPPKREVLLRQRVMQKLRPREEQSDCDSGGGSPSESETSDEKTKKKLTVSPHSKLDESKKTIPEIRPTVLPKPVVLTPRRILTKPVFPKQPSPPQPPPKANRKEFFENRSAVLRNSQSLKEESEVRKMLGLGIAGDENSSVLLNEESDASCRTSNSRPQTATNEASRKVYTRLKRKVRVVLEKDNAKKLKSQRLVSRSIANYCSGQSLTQCARSKFRTCRVKEA